MRWPATQSVGSGVRLAAMGRTVGVDPPADWSMRNRAGGAIGEDGEEVEQFVLGGEPQFRGGNDAALGGQQLLDEPPGALRGDCVEIARSISSWAPTVSSAWDAPGMPSSTGGRRCRDGTRRRSRIGWRPRPRARAGPVRWPDRRRTDWAWRRSRAAKNCLSARTGDSHFPSDRRNVVWKAGRSPPCVRR